MEHSAPKGQPKVDPEDRLISSMAAAKADGLPEPAELGELAETSGDQRSTSAQAPPVVRHRRAGDRPAHAVPARLGHPGSGKLPGLGGDTTLYRTT